MDQDIRKTDITNKVYGKMDQGSMSLYLNKDKIGKITFTNQGNLYEMGEGFEFDSDKIYRHDSNPPAQNQQLVDDCEFGWC
ncbi:YusG family protein [Alkalihalobacillus sp. TS-13]|uniref:YusG family protein n=1 Tax=Alkalihalobacillus sp. TS-13 TaxID=2842455 RepID=UPI001C888D0F|nr:YusG family protein [Alkalihalobacillus sp. TS-13]